MPRTAALTSTLVLLACAFSATGAAAAAAAPADAGARSTFQIRSVPAGTAPIVVDGDLSDEGWRDATPIETWYEIDPGTNVEPKVKSVAKLAYDDRYLYVAFDLADPDPSAIRAPVTDRDNALTSSDYAGVVIDGRNDGKTAQEFLANPRGVQYDGIWSDLAGEDLAPNFYWSSAAKVGPAGWTLELAIPFSSIRYDPVATPVWGISLFRNWPRAFRYQLSTALQPLDAPCFICNENQLAGLENLPKAGSLVVAPYGVARRTDLPEGRVPGASLENDDVDGELGLDLKWTPNARHTFDLTVRPDFSQVEGDVAQIATNQRFALFFPEQRPFFLEQVDLFSTPIAAVYTRTVTAPRAGLRATGRVGRSSYTLLVSDDRGGGSVVIPGDTSSDFAPQDFESSVVLGRMRRDFGPSYLSVLVSDREVDDGGFNRVFGPDFQWQPRSADTIVGQLLWSRSETPVRPDLADEWDGRELSGAAALLYWQHDDGTWDSFLQGEDLDSEFRADNGFVPQVGYQRALFEGGRTWRPESGVLSRVRLFSFDQYSTDEDDEILRREFSGGVELGGARNLALRLRYTVDDQQVARQLLTQEQLRFALEMAPSAVFARLALSGYFGGAIDFDNAREGDGGGVALEAIFRSPVHLETKLNAERNVLDVDEPRGGGRLFTADLARARVTWTFTPRTFVRVIAQWVQTERDPSLYLFPVSEKDSDFESSVLFAYKWNWQSVLYVGYGDAETFLRSSGRREPTSRQVFVKLSWAFQRGG